MMPVGLPISDLQISLADFREDVRTETSSILNVPISVLTMQSALERVNQWVRSADRPHLVTFVNAHMAVEARLRPAFLKKLQRMDLNCPDGAPIFWLARRSHGARAEKISGPEFMPRFCEQSVALGHRHFLYGGTEGVAADACKALRFRYPGIKIAGHYCPPFRPLDASEKAEVVKAINASGADVVWVCLGCPKQEQWMYEMRDELQAKVMLAVGQAFDIIAGRTQRAPAVFRDCGAEWIYRLAMEPRRLWKRYLVTNLLFILFILRAHLEGERGACIADS